MILLPTGLLQQDGLGQSMGSAVKFYWVQAYSNMLIIVALQKFIGVT
jgi:hypothetical protein